MVFGLKIPIDGDYGVTQPEDVIGHESTIFHSSVHVAASGQRMFARP
jgi:hypothetical protein